MVFKDYYENLSEKGRVELRDRIIKETEISMPTFYNWMREDKFPKVYRIVIAQIMEKSVDELFPEKL